MQRFLESNSSAPIPGDSALVTLADLARGIEAFVSAEDAILLEFKDAATAALIAHDPQAAASTVISPGAAFGRLFPGRISAPFGPP